MDIGAFVQENRRWLIGCAIGMVAFFIAYFVIGSVYDPEGAGSGIVALVRQQPASMYPSSTVDALLDEAEQLAVERERLEKMLAFERSPHYGLQPGIKADEYLYQVGGTLKRAVLDGANERGIQVSEKEIAWSMPPGIDEIQMELFGLELLDETVKRLFAAHDAVRRGDEEAIGLRAILQLRTEARRGSRRPVRRGGRDEVDVNDLVEQERVQFKFEADAETAAAFFESCRHPGRTLVVESAQMQQPERITDPIVVTGSLIGIAFKKEQP